MAAVAAALLFRVVEVRRDADAPALRVPAVPFALLPVATFVVQENVERLAHGGSALGALPEPTFRVGVLLQLPVAFLAYLLTRLLLRVAERVGSALRRLERRPRRPSATRVPRSVRIELARRPGVLAVGRAGRAPPGFALA